MSAGLVVLGTHPVQYLAPVYRAVQKDFDIPVTAIYGSDFSISGYRDDELQSTFAWDTDLLSGYASIFLTRVERGGPPSVKHVSGAGVYSMLRRLRPKGVLINGYSHPFDRSAIRAAIATRVPILFRGETTDHATKRSVMKRMVRDGILRTLYPRFEKLLYVGTKSRNHYERLGCKPRDLIFSPYCVDDTAFSCDDTVRERLRPSVREELKATLDDLILLYCGKLSAGKGVPLLVKAVSLLPEEVRARTIVTFVGDGELHANLASDGRPSQPRTRLAGFKNQTELSPYYHAADLLVVPSLGDTWGLVVNEALHHGLPAVITDAVGCGPDLIQPGATGEIAIAGSADSLRDAIIRAISLTRRKSIREACRAQIAPFSVREAARGISKAWEQIAGY